MAVKTRLQEMRILIAIVLAVTGGVSSACVQQKPAPERSFTTLDLLIELSDMPVGWRVSDGPGRAEDYISSKDASGIVFIAGTDWQRRVASHRVYRYRSVKAAKGVYEYLVLPDQVGKTPAEWAYQSPVADQSYFACYDYEGREPYPICEWSARYEEYVVIFHSWLVPGYMSLEDLERVVRAIDARMAEYLGRPLESED